jgi:ATP-dependent Clp protease adaptor protein ClpS
MADDTVRSGEGAAVKEAPSRPKLDQMPPYRVLLHNDDVNAIDWVVDTITELTPHPREMAVQLTMEAHFRGLTLLLVTHKERAELYHEQFASKGLVVTIEPAQ